MRDDAGLRASLPSFRRYALANFPEAYGRRLGVTVLRDDPPPGEEAQVDFGRLGKWTDIGRGLQSQRTNLEWSGKSLRPREFLDWAYIPEPGGDRYRCGAVVPAGGWSQSPRHHAHAAVTAVPDDRTGGHAGIADHAVRDRDLGQSQGRP